jgi:hypothetical protein
MVERRSLRNAAAGLLMGDSLAATRVVTVDVDDGDADLRPPARG